MTIDSGTPSRTMPRTMERAEPALLRLPVSAPAISRSPT